MQYHNGKLVYSKFAYGGYVRDGLILQLDCRRIPVENEWFTDITGNARMFVRTSSKNEDGTMDLYSLGSDVLNVDTNEQYTIEVCGTGEFVKDFSFESAVIDSNNKGIYYGNFFGSVDGIAVFARDKIIRYTIPLASESVSTLSGFCYDGRDASYLDGEVRIPYSTEDNEYAKRSSMYVSAYNVYSIRIYNRVLMQKEREHNYAMDKKNFVKPDVPTNVVLLNGGEPIQLFGGEFVELNKN